MNQSDIPNIPATNASIHPDTAEPLSAPASRPDFIAYQVQEGKNGKAYFNKVGVAWQHKDGQGYELDLAAVPVNGRVSLRTLRDNRMQGYQEQQQANGQNQDQSQAVNQGHVPQQ